MKQYGYIDEYGYLKSKILEPYTQKVQNEEGETIEEEITIEAQATELIELGWKPVDLVDDSHLNPSEEFSSVRIVPFDNGDRISFNYIETSDVNLINGKIDRLKKELTDSDYKIIKSYEANLLEIQAPYNIKELHAEREKIRQEINELEKLLL